MNDAGLKDLLCRHFGAQGWYVRPEVPVFHRGGVYEHPKLVTDIDVLALRPGTDLRWELVLGDCKTLRAQSPANRVLWLRGLMDQLSARAGIVLLQRKQQIETDHKLFAASLNVILLDEDEFLRYDHALIFPAGSADCPVCMRALDTLRAVPRQYPALQRLYEYLHAFGWAETSWLELVRKVPGETLAISRELDPGKASHLATVLEAAAVFSVGLAECVGIVFNQYLQPDSLAELDDALKVIIWGGRANYEFVAKLRRDLVAARGFPENPSGPLALPNWTAFLQLTRTLLDSPRLAFALPALLQRTAIDVALGNPVLSDVGPDYLPLLKYGMMVTDYLCVASRFPPQARATLEGIFVRRQSELVHAYGPTRSQIPNARLVRRTPESSDTPRKPSGPESQQPEDEPESAAGRVESAVTGPTRQPERDEMTRDAQPNSEGTETGEIGPDEALKRDNGPSLDAAQNPQLDLGLNEQHRLPEDE